MYRIQSVPQEVLTAIRALAHSRPEDARVEVSTAPESGYGPCRSCLRQFNPGERRVLFRHRPMHGGALHDESGPVFVHLDACEAYPPQGGFPPEVSDGRCAIELTLRSYSQDGRLLQGALLGNESIDALIERLFANPEAQRIRVYNAEYGCFICLLERVQVDSDAITAAPAPRAQTPRAAG